MNSAPLQPPTRTALTRTALTQTAPGRAATVPIRPPRTNLVDQRYPGGVDDGAASTYPRYWPVPVPSVVAYELTTGEHAQRGLVVEVAVSAYRARRIRGHEATQPERVHRLVERAQRTGVEQVPVVLTQRHATGLASVLDRASATDPDVELEGQDGSTHRVWHHNDPALVQQLVDAMASVETLYIADGHHRMAAARQYADRSIAGAVDVASDADDPSGYTLAVIVPSERLRILGYHRCVRWPEGLSEDTLLSTIRARPVVERVAPCAGGAPEAEPGVVGMYAAGRWYHVRLRTALDHVNTRSALDVVELDEDVLAPLLGVDEVGPSLMPLAGDRSAEELAAWCDAQRAIGFRLHPPSVQQVLDVADAGQLLPAKSTWFDPKAAAGLFSRALR